MDVHTNAQVPGASTHAHMHMCTCIMNIYIYMIIYKYKCMILYRCFVDFGFSLTVGSLVPCFPSQRSSR